MIRKKKTHNQVIISEPRRIAFPLQVLPDGRVIIHSKDAYGACIEAHDIEQHTPHTKVKYAPGLAKHATQTIAGPLERATVAQDTERHLGLGHLDGALVQPEEAEKVRVRRRVEDDLQKSTNELVGEVVLGHLETRTKPLSVRGRGEGYV